MIELGPADLHACNNLDTAHAMRGEIDRVVGLRENVLEMDPSSQKATNNIAEAEKRID